MNTVPTGLPAPIPVRQSAGGHNTTAGVNRGATGRLRDGRSPSSGLWRAGSASRPSRRPSRRTGTSAARSSPVPVPDTVDSPWRTARCRRTGKHGHTVVGPRCGPGAGVLVASRVLSGCVRIPVVAPSELPVGRHAKWPTCAAVITRGDERCTDPRAGRGGVTARQC